MVSIKPPPAGSSPLAERPAPAAPKDAATVVVVREGRRGIELFCVKRSSRSGFMAGAVVFPGGKVDRSDDDEQWAEHCTTLGQRVRAFADDERRARAFAIAGLRETLEEAAILPVAGGPLGAGDTLSLRDALKTNTGAHALRDLLIDRGLRLDTARLEGLSRWITPTAEPKRYDTRFYVLALPEGQHGAHDEYETTQSFWARPEEILERWEAGEIFLAPPTSHTIEQFIRVRSTEAALATARRHTLRPICPAFVKDGDAMILTLPGDPLHPGPSSPEVTQNVTRFILEGGRFVPRRATVRRPRETRAPR